MKTQRKAKHIIAVAGGKGGVGKSVFSITLGATLAEMGHKVVLVDFDLGGANLHTYLGIMGRTPTLASFFHKKASTLDEILIDTKTANLKLISGAYYSPNMSSPASTLKHKVMRHMQGLDADFVIIDLGAGMDLSTLDFFIFSDYGILVTVPEPGAVMNAYRFIKGALFRKLNNVFGRHLEIGPMLAALGEDSSNDDSLKLNWFITKVKETDADVYPIIVEISTGFTPFLILNRIGSWESERLVAGLLRHCTDKYGVKLRYIGNLPDTRELSGYLLDVPSFLKSQTGKPYRDLLKAAAGRLLSEINNTGASHMHQNLRRDYDDQVLEQVSDLVELLDDSIFDGDNKKLWKLRLYFKPVEVIKFLLSKGIRNPIFFETQQEEHLDIVQ